MTTINLIRTDTREFQPIATARGNHWRPGITDDEMSEKREVYAAAKRQVREALSRAGFREAPTAVQAVHCGEMWITDTHEAEIRTSGGCLGVCVEPMSRITHTLITPH